MKRRTEIKKALAGMKRKYEIQSALHMFGPWVIYLELRALWDLMYVVHHWYSRKASDEELRDAYQKYDKGSSHQGDIDGIHDVE